MTSELMTNELDIKIEADHDHEDKTKGTAQLVVETEDGRDKNVSRLFGWGKLFRIYFRNSAIRLLKN